MAWFKKDKECSLADISDFHLQNGPYDFDVVTRALIRSLPALKGRMDNPEVVFATGDIAFSGKAGEYSRATEFFDKN